MLEPASTRRAVKLWSAVVSVPKAIVSGLSVSPASADRPAARAGTTMTIGRRDLPPAPTRYSAIWLTSPTSDG